MTAARPSHTLTAFSPPSADSRCFVRVGHFPLVQNCFLRIFKTAGRYSSFGEKTLPSQSSEDRARSETTDGAPSASPPAERRGSVVLPCVVADCKGARVARKSYCIEHLNANNATSNEGTPAFNELIEAITNKNVDKVQQILAGEETTAIVFQKTSQDHTHTHTCTHAQHAPHLPRRHPHPDRCFLSLLYVFSIVRLFRQGCDSTRTFFYGYSKFTRLR